jgi:hypothetical protein
VLAGIDAAVTFIPNNGTTEAVNGTDKQQFTSDYTALVA